jgi:hypothetical protein
MMVGVPSTTLLVHLCPWSNAIDSHEEHLLGLNHAKQDLNVVENVGKYFFFCDAEMWVVVIRMRTIVNYAIHVEI